MKAKLFDYYYKFGFNHYIYKYLMGLHKPNAGIVIFYTGLMTAILALGIFVI